MCLFIEQISDLGFKVEDLPDYEQTLTFKI